MIDFGEAAPIDALITEFRSQLTGDNGALSSSTANPPLERTSGNAVRHIESGRTHPSLNPDIGQRIRALIFDPIIEILNSRKRIILSPDGKLALLPFEILPLDNDKYVVDEFQLCYVNVGREVLRFGQALHNPPSRSLVIADPDYNLGTTQSDNIDRLTGQSTNNLPGMVQRLPGTSQEGEQVARLLNAQLLIGETALSSTLRSIQSP
jgi:hypothetical protein